MDEPLKYFAVLESAYRHPDWVNFGDNPPGWYHRCERDDPSANEFRANMEFSWHKHSIPLGNDRERAVSIVNVINKAYEAGINKDMHEKRGYQEVLVGRTGNRTRDESSIP